MAGEPVQRILPTKAPTPAVTAIASAPQKAARIIPAATFAPPVRAAIAPSAARQTSEVPATRGPIFCNGAIAVMNKGTAAPAAKLAA